jgi:hypothetical protein
MSEKYDTPFILRLTTRVSHSGSVVEMGERADIAIKEYTKDIAKHVMMPANAKKRHYVVEDRLAALANELAASDVFNKVEKPEGATLGIITAGNCYNYAKEVFGEGAAYLKGVIRLKGATGKDLKMGALSLISRLDADLRFEAPQKVIESLDGGRDAMMGAVDGGYAELKGDRVVSHLEFHAGELRINDKVQGIPGLGAPATSPE